MMTLGELGLALLWGIALWLMLIVALAEILVRI